MKYIYRAILVFSLLALASVVSAQGVISPGDTVEASLSNNTAQYTFTGKAGELLVIDLKSSDFDTLVKVLDANGVELAQDDDGGDAGTDSRLAFTVPESGQYTIQVGGFGGTATGAYTLSISGVAPTAISYGSTTQGAGAEGGVFYNFEGKAGDVLNIFLVSAADDDTRLDLNGPDGAEVASDDDSGTSRNPYLRRVILPSDGVYLLKVSAPYVSNWTGRFNLTVEQTENLVLDANVQTVTLGGEFDQEVFRFDAASATTYRLVIQPSDRDVSYLSMSVDIAQDNASQNSLTITGMSRVAVDFTPNTSGLTEIRVRFFSFTSSTTFDISLSPAE